ncbi:MAG: TetR/AcrR family transcriptional regulator [Ilumatobacteraceae bacterium]
MSEIGGALRKNANGATTMETLIRFGVEELKRSGSVNFNLENVLRESGIARGSLYHHFGSRHGLISHCEATLLKSSLKSENEIIRSVIESGKSGEELFELLAGFTRINGSEALREQRGRRVRTLAASVEDDSLRTLIAESQMKGSQFLVDSFQMAMDKGLIKPRVPLDALVYLIQAMFLGRILVDITQDSALSDSVNEVTVTTLRYLLNPQP